MGKIGKAIALAAIVIGSAGAATAEVFRLIPTNAQVAGGSFGPVLQVWRSNGGTVDTFRVASGEIPRSAVVNGREAIEWVRVRYGVNPARDRIYFCPSGTLHVTCNDPDDPRAEILVWP